MDVENGESSGRSEMEEPLIQHINIKHEIEDGGESKSKGLLKVALPNTFVAVLSSYEFSISMGYSAPVQSAIIKDLRLSISEVCALAFNLQSSL
ncbi:sugar transporter ERD6-like 16 [Hibiscus syriacus]|uniref:sugar transporter ERD6-like 16 n=1 Tax=Hibiscus syriacus TaxID=106335 RepID=UPI001923AA21|nr:sugar transporter ERD6-like 16 [Hibiscus syriacus]